MRAHLRRIALLVAGCAGLVHAGPVPPPPGGVTVDSTTFVAGSGIIGTVGGVYSDTLPPVRSTTTAAGRMTAYRAMHINLRNNSGTEIGTVSNPLQVSGQTTVNLSTVTVVNSSFSVTGSTVNINGTVPVSISGTPTFHVNNSSFSVTGSTVSVTGSTVTLSNTGFAVTNTPNVVVSAQIPSGGNNIGTVSGSSVTVTNGALSVTGSTVSITNASFVVSGDVDATGSTVTITNTGFAVTNTPAVTISGTPSFNVVNISTVTPKTGSTWNVTGSTVTVNGTVAGSGIFNTTGSTVTVNGSVNIGNTPGVSIINTPGVTISGTPNVAVTSMPSVTIGALPAVTVTNSSFSVTGSTVNVQGSLTAVISSTIPVSVVGTPTVNAVQSGTWANTIQVLNGAGSPASVGYSGGALAVPAQLTDGVNIASVTATSFGNGINVNIVGNQAPAAGGTSSSFQATYPNLGTAVGFSNPSGLMQAARVDASSNVYVNVTQSSFSVTGSTVNIAGTISISSATPFNVTGSTINIGGTPNVSVTNTPNVSVTNTPNVSVTNTVGTTLTSQLPVGTNNIGTVTGSTVTVSGSIAATIAGTVDTYQTNPSTVTFNGVAQPVTAAQSGTWNVNAYVTNPTTATVSGTVAATQSGTWNVNSTPVGATPIISTNTLSVAPASGQAFPVISTTTLNVAAAQTGTWTVQPGNTQNTTPWLVLTTATVNTSSAQSGTWTNTVTQGTNSNLRGSFMIDGSSNTVQITGTPSVNATLQTGTAAIGKVNFNTPTTASLTSAAISASSTGDNIIVSTVSLQTVRIFRIYFVVSAATTITFKSGGGTNLSGAISLLANGAMVFDFDAEPWFVTAASQAFIINQTGTATIAGTVYYTQS